MSVPVPGTQVQLLQVSSLPVGIALIRNYNGPQQIVVSILQTVKQIYMRIMTDQREGERRKQHTKFCSALQSSCSFFFFFAV